MLRFDCFDFYKLGLAVHPLTELEDAISAQEVWVALYLAKTEVDTFFRTFPLKTSRTPATEFYRAIAAIVPDDLGDMQLVDGEGKPRILGQGEISLIKRAARDFETVLRAELSGWDSLFVSPKAAYNTAELISQAELMVPESGRKIMSPKAVADFRQAGMCLAFNLGTAAAFHAARSTETVIALYYEKLLGSLPTIKSRNWGAYHRNLAKCPSPDAKVLAWLKHLTEEYRNPVLHPEETLSTDAAIEFLNACIALITSIARALEKIEEKKSAETQ